MPYRWPKPDPVRAENGNYRVEQPYIHRLTHLGAAAAERGRGLPLLREVSHLIWSGETNGWHQGDLRRATERAGLHYDERTQAVNSSPERYAAIVQENQDAQRAAGHWGVPMMVFDGEPFFGQDRVDQLPWRMRRRGVQPRS